MLLFWSCRLAAGACLSSVCDLRQPHGHKHTRTQWDDLGNYEKRVREEEEERIVWRRRSGGRAASRLVVGASLLPGVMSSSGDGAVTAQPDGIYVPITTSLLFCINSRHKHTLTRTHAVPF